MKAANSYLSLLRGVSQQVPQERAEGQHTEQVNLLSDPVNGLTRRHGTAWRAERTVSGLVGANRATYVADTANWTTIEFNTGNKKYAVMLRRDTRVAAAMPAMVVYNKTDRVFLTVARNLVDAPLDALEANGVSTATPVGKYLFLAANGVTVTSTSTEVWSDLLFNADQSVVWIRGGAFSRTYTVKVRNSSGTLFTATHTTPSSSYQGILDTSAIAASDPEYTKKVNDIVNAYNGEVTNWIGTSTAAIQPSAIAQALRNGLNSAGLGVGLEPITVVGSHIVFPGSKNIVSVEVDDGGDGSLIRGVANEIESVDKTSVIHAVGKVVKVRSRNASEAFYLKAVAKDKAVTSGYTEVTWIEGAGVEHAITGGLFYATIVGNNFYVASSATLLNVLTPGEHPTFPVSTAGDSDSSPLPFFVGREISYLGTFQNRLLIGSGGVLALSKTDDYLNFFRSTLLTVPGNDPFEMQPSGGEDDSLRHSVLYNQDLVVFGNKRQYVIRGNAALTPTSANMSVMGSYEDVAQAAPVSAGGFVFYAKRGNGSSSIHQIQPGQTENSPESFPASSQLDSYLAGGVIEMVSATGSPSLLLARATGARSSVYCFAYLDRPDGRKLDSWSRWDFNPVLGSIIGMSVLDGGVDLYFLRESSAGTFYTVADFQSIKTAQSDKPYLDSNRPWANVISGTGSVISSSGDNWAAAFDSTSERRFTGSLLSTVAALQAAYPSEPGLTVGSTNDAYFVPTNPFMRDNKNKAIISGRLTISKLLLAFKDSIGFKWTLTYRNVDQTPVEFNGRVLGDPNNLIGIEPISTGTHSIPVGIETRKYSIKIAARRWYPFTVTALEWVGQFFNRVQRF